MKYLNERFLDQLQLIVTIIDHACYDQDDKSSHYTDALINTLYSQNMSCSHEIHEMIEIEKRSFINQKKTLKN